MCTLGTIYSVSWSPDGSQLLTASSDKTCKLWDFATKKHTQTFLFGADVKRPEISDMQLSTAWEGKSLFSVSLSGAINVLNAETGEHTSIHGCMRPIKAFALDRANRCFYTGEGNGVVIRWDLDTKLGQFFAGKKADVGVNGLRVAANGLLEVILADDKLRSFSATELQRSDDKKQTPVPVGGVPRKFKSSNTNPSIGVAVTGNKKLLIFNDGKIASTTALDFEPLAVAWSTDDATIFVGGKNKAVVAFSYDGSTGAVALKDWTVETYDWCEHLVVHPAGQIVVAVDKKKSISAINIENARVTNSDDPLRFHDMKIRDVAFSPSGNKLATCSTDGTVIVWYNGFGGQRLRIPNASAQAVTFVEFIDETTVLALGDNLVFKTFTIAEEWA